MKKFQAILLAGVLVWGAGCSSTGRAVSNAVIGGGAAGVAAKLSDGNPFITAGAGAAGVIASEAAHAWGNKKTNEAYQGGYIKGRSDAVKSQYWFGVRQQQYLSHEPDSSISFYEIPLPQRETHDGVILAPSTRVLRIQE